MENKNLEMKAKKMEVISVDYSDFDRFVEKVYGQSYEYLADQEANNDSERLYTGISGKLDEYDTEDITKFKETGEGSYMARTLLEDLCKNKNIEPGNYLIRVCW